MDIGTGSITSLLRRWERDSTYDSRRALHGHTAFVRHMCVTSIGDAHANCVNRLALNRSATLLISGSDDCNLVIWNIDGVSRIVPRTTLSPGHFANIFGVDFMPDTGDSYVVSAGLDRQVRHTSVETSHSRLWTCHNKMVKTVVAVDANTFISASKDATARLFDVRCSNRAHDAQNAHVVVQNRQQHFGGLNSAMLSPTSSHHLLVASNDPYLRVYDLRFSVSNRQSNGRQHRTSSTGHVLEKYCPCHLHECSAEQCVSFLDMHNNYSTFATFSQDGKRIIGSYFDDAVHVFERSNGNDTVCRLPFKSKAALQRAIWRILQQCASVLALNYPNISIGRSNTVLEMDGDNLLALLFLADALMRRDDAGDCRSARMILERMMAILQGDAKAVRELWGYQYECGPRCFPEEWNSWEEKADAWLHILKYMRGVALFRMIPPFPFSQLVRPNSTNRLLTRKRLQHLQSVCDEVEKFQERLLSKYEGKKKGFERIMQRCALGSEKEAKILYCNSAAIERKQVLAFLVKQFTTGMDELRNHVGGRMENVVRSEESENEERDVRYSDKEEEWEWLWGGGDIRDSSGDLEDDASGEGNGKRESRSFHGHVSQQTDIKEARFFGSRDQVVMSGSDDGHVYLWCARTSELLGRVSADEQIVNCVVGHPRHYMMMASGLDRSIKVVRPREQWRMEMV